MCVCVDINYILPHIVLIIQESRGQRPSVIASQWLHLPCEVGEQRLSAAKFLADVNISDFLHECDEATSILAVAKKMWTFSAELGGRRNEEVSVKDMEG